MKRLILFILAVMLCMPAMAVSSKNEINLIWMNENQQQIKSTVIDAKSYQLVPTLNTLVDIWLQRDGATTGEVSTYIILALIHHQELMLSMLVENEKSFIYWLSEFQGIVFTDFSGDSFDELQSLHNQLSASMAECIKKCDSNLAINAKKILNKLNETEVRAVD